MLISFALRRRSTWLLPLLATAVLATRPVPAQEPVVPAKPAPAKPAAAPAWPAIAAPTVANAAYGTNPRQVLDFWQAPGDAPAPLVLYFHGGGFTGGDKRSENRFGEVLAYCQAHQLACATANYRLAVGPDGAPMPASLQDGARALQFLRSKAAEWHIDPKRVVVAGSSAGGVISLYIALHEELAQPAAKNDPVAQQSTRVQGVMAWVAITSCDPKVGQALGVAPEGYANNATKLFGVKTLAELETPAMRAMLADCSALDLASKGDPPALLVYGDAPTPLALPPNVDWGTLVHHPYWGKLLKAKLDAVGVPCTFYPGEPPQHVPKDVIAKYLQQVFGTK